MPDIIQGDSLELLKTLPSASFDAVITDPPYSRNTITAHSRNAVRNLADLSIQEFFYREMFKQIARVLKDGGVSFTFCDDLFYPILFSTSYSHLQGHSLITWDKGQISFGKPIRKRHELIMYASKNGGGTFYPSADRAHYPSVVSFAKVRDKVHDAEKPVELLRDLIIHFTPENGRVLDPFMGSGSTLVAAQNAGRYALGIELNAEHAETARARIEKGRPVRARASSE